MQDWKLVLTAVALIITGAIAWGDIRSDVDNQKDSQDKHEQEYKQDVKDMKLDIREILIRLGPK